jgi:hypothetical protein
LAATTLAGILLILVAFLVESADPFLSKLILTFGSSMLGTAFGILFNSFNHDSILQRIRQLIEESITSPLAAPEEELSALRTVWHNYMLTKVGGKPVWRYRRFDFSKTMPPGKLTSSFETTNPKNPSYVHKYNVEGHLAGPRLILVISPDGGSEPPGIQLYPFVTDRFSTLHAGLVILRDWDKENLRTGSLLSTNPLDLGTPYSEGTLDQTMSAKLCELWQAEAANSGLTKVLIS